MYEVCMYKTIFYLVLNPTGFNNQIINFDLIFLCPV